MTHSAEPTPDWIQNTDVAWIRRLAQSLCKDAGLADDAAQETLLVWMRRRPGVSASPGWLRRVLENRLAQARRAEQRRSGRERAAARREAEGGDVLERARLQREVMDAVLGLDEPYRSTVLMRFFEGQIPSKIAARTGTPVETVKTRLKRGLAKLRESLDEEHGGDRSAWIAAFGSHLIQGAAVTGGVALFPSLASIMAMKHVLVPVAAAAIAAVYLITPATEGPAEPGSSAVARSASAASGTILSDVADDVAAPSFERTAVPSLPQPTAAPTPAVPEGRVAATVEVFDLNSVLVPNAPVSWHPTGAESTDPAGARPIGTTGIDGSLVVELERRQADLRVESSRWTTVQTGTIQAIGSTAKAVIVVAPPRTIEGRVVDHTGWPVAFAELVYTSAKAPWTTLETAVDHAGAVRLRTKADADGAFSYERAPELEEGWVELEQQGAKTQRATVASRGNVWVEIRLDPPSIPEGFLSGIVVHRSGAPAEGAWVSLGYSASRTGANGAFTIDPKLPMSGDVITAILPGHLPGTITKDSDGNWPQPLILELGEEPLTLAGQVVRSDGSAVVGVRVRLVGSTDFGMLETPGEDVMTAVSVESFLGNRSGNVVEISDDGAFRFDGLLPIRYGLVATDPATMACVRLESVAAGRSDVTVMLEAPAETIRVRGLVVDLAGEPIPEAWLHLRASVPAAEPGGEPFELASTRRQTDADGAFDFGEVARRGNITLHVYAGQGFGFREVAVDRDELVVEVPRLASFFVEAGPDADGFELRDESGQPQSLFQKSGHAMFAMTTGFFQEGRSPVFSVSEGQWEVVLIQGQEVVARRRTEVRAGKPTRVVF